MDLKFGIIKIIILKVKQLKMQKKKSYFNYFITYGSNNEYFNILDILVLSDFNEDRETMYEEEESDDEESEEINVK